MDLSTEDYALIQLTAVELTSSASLDRSPKQNWVEKAGNLPPYIRKLARAIEKSGKPLSSAIAIAIGRVKDWAAGGDDVDPDTMAKAAKALAQWEKLKAKNAANQVAKLSREDGSEYLMLSNTGSYNVEIVRTAWNRQRSEQRRAERTAVPEVDYDDSYSWIRELWSDFIIVESGRDTFARVKYTVKSGVVTFGEPEPVELNWKKSTPLSTVEEKLLGDILVQR